MHANQKDAYDSTIFQADCANCFGLCCVALAFAASADFPVDKAGGVPCRNLNEDFRCSIHRNVRLSGYSGCTVFDCLGAGQKVSQQIFGGLSWRDDLESAQKMFQLLPVMQQLQEMLLYLTQAIERCKNLELLNALLKSRDAVAEVTFASAEELLAVDLPEYRMDINHLLSQVSEEVRLASGRFNKRNNRKKGPHYQGVDLMGAKFQGKDLKGSTFRGAYLIGADFRNADMRNSDFIGADMRDADLSGADLTGSVYLTQMQLNSTKGDGQTKVPALLSKPAHWKAG